MSHIIFLAIDAKVEFTMKSEFRTLVAGWCNGSSSFTESLERSMAAEGAQTTQITVMESGMGYFS